MPPVGAATDGPFTVVSVHLGGDVLSARVDNPEGHETRPVTWPRLREKFDDCVSGPADAAWDGLRNLRAVTDVQELVTTLADLTGRNADPAAPPRTVGPAGLHG